MFLGTQNTHFLSRCSHEAQHQAKLGPLISASWVLFSYALWFSAL